MDQWQIQIGMTNEDEPEPALLCAQPDCSCQQDEADAHRDVRVILYSGEIESSAIDEELERHIRRYG